MTDGMSGRTHPGHRNPPTRAAKRTAHAVARNNENLIFPVSIRSIGSFALKIKGETNP